jgi:hypothetical protein
MTTQAVAIAVNTGDFGTRRRASKEQRKYKKSNFSFAGSPPPHGWHRCA